MIVTGIDISTPMLAHARKRVLDATFVNASADALAFPAESFDGAVSAQAFHWFDAPQVLAEVARVVRPYGVVAIWWKTMMHGDRVRMLRAEVASELAEPAAAATSCSENRSRRSTMRRSSIAACAWSRGK